MSNTHERVCDLDIMQRQLWLKFPFTLESESEVKACILTTEFLHPHPPLAQENCTSFMNYFPTIFCILQRKYCHVHSKREKRPAVLKKPPRKMYLAIKDIQQEYIPPLKWSIHVEMYFRLGLTFLKQSAWVSPHSTEIQRYYYDKNFCVHVRLQGENILEVHLFTAQLTLYQKHMSKFCRPNNLPYKKDWIIRICASNGMLLYVLNFYLSVLK